MHCLFDIEFWTYRKTLLAHAIIVRQQNIITSLSTPPPLSLSYPSNLQNSFINSSKIKTNNLLCQIFLNFFANAPFFERTLGFG
jgi:hypothetical protein